MIKDAPLPRRPRQPPEYLLGSSLREQRKAAGLSQETLAARVGSSQSRIAHWEAGDDDDGCDIEMIALLAVTLDCPPASLMHDAGKARYEALMKALSTAA